MHTLRVQQKAAHSCCDETPAAANEAAGNRTGHTLSHRTPGGWRGDTGARQRTPLTHHSAVNWLTAASGDTGCTPPVIHCPQAPASSCADKVARSQSMRIAVDTPATMLAAIAVATGGLSAVADSAACHRLYSSCSLTRVHSSRARGRHTVRSPTATTAKVGGGLLPGSMIDQTSQSHCTTAAAAEHSQKTCDRLAAAPLHAGTGHRLLTHR